MDKQNSTAPRTKPAELRLNELMDSAQRLFIAKGFSAATVSEIVRDAGVAKGTFYHYFASKDEMLSALRERFTRHFIEQIQQAVDACPADDGIARLRAWCRAGVAAYFSGLDVHDALYHDHLYATRSNRDRDAVLAQIRTLLEQGQRSGAWSLEEPALTAIVMYHGMHGAVDSAALDDRTNWENLGDRLVQEFMRLVGCG